MFIDEASFTIEAGKGGDGAVSFRRERYVPKGGPDGGDGGDGGAVVFIGKHDMHTLSDFRAKKQYTAENGQNGMHKKMHGKNGQDLVISVPLGTRIQLSNDTGEKVTEVDVVDDGQRYVAAKGGNGGWGNTHFATSIKQSPAWSKLGHPGQRFNISLELRLIADVGLVGLPNAGKSTLLASITNARPKIADYPFTTLEPQLGVVSYDTGHFVMADIPGLIEGASHDKGLGLTFLKHIMRTKLMLYVIDATDKDPKATIATLKTELGTFDASLLEKPSVIVLNKTDLLSATEQKQLEKKFPRGLFISCATGDGVTALVQSLTARVTS